MSTKAVIVTGGNRGIGKAIVQGLWNAGGYHIILACRDKASGEKAAESVRIQQGGGAIDVMSLDLCDFASVRRFTNEFKTKNLPLFAIVNNAGILRWKGWVQTKDGFEEHLQANHLGHFLLVSELLELLLRRPGSRVVAVGSHLADYCTLNLVNLNEAQGFDAYKQSKLANFLHIQELHRRYGGSPHNMRTMCIDPGEVDTDITRYFPFPTLINAILRFMPERHTPEQGADSAVHCVTCEDAAAAALSGCFVRDRQAVDLSSSTGTAFSRLVLWLVMTRPDDPDGRGAGAASRLWLLSEALVNGQAKLPGRTEPLRVAVRRADAGIWMLLALLAALFAAAVTWLGGM